MEYSTRIHDKWLSVHRTPEAPALFAVNRKTLRKSSFLVEGSSLVILSEYGGHIILHQAGSEEDARTILNTMLTACDNESARLKTRRFQHISLPIAFILAAIVGIKMLDILTTPRIVHEVTGSQMPSPHNIPATRPVIQAQDEPPRPPVPDAQASDIRDVLARNLHNAAARKQFTVTLSTGHERTLYVFADPECPNCRIFEPAVQALSQYFNIEVFPVSLIGKEDTAREVVPVLCAPARARPVLWRNLFDIGAGMLTLGKDNTGSTSQPTPCDTGTEALALNDKAFAVYHLPGTPTVIADDGRQVPFTSMKTVSTLNAFLAQP